MNATGRQRVRVTVESPYKGDVDTHVAYLRRALLDSTLNHFEAPLASHGFYTGFLDDNDPEQRAIGIECGLRWAEIADKVVFYCDYGMSPGMQQAEDFHRANGMPLESRFIGQNP